MRLRTKRLEAIRFKGIRSPKGMHSCAIAREIQSFRNSSNGTASYRYAVTMNTRIRELKMLRTPDSVLNPRCGWPLMAVLGLACAMPLAGYSDERPAAETIDNVELPITVSAELPADSPRLEDVNDGTFFVRVRIKNTGDDSVVLWPYLSAQLMDADGDDVPASMQIGRWGLRAGDKDSILEEIEFVELDAGQTYDLDVRVNRCVCDSQFITGWRLSRRGEYRLALQYVFDRQQVKETFGKGCRVLDDDDQDWNHALETDAQIEVSFTVK